MYQTTKISQVDSKFFLTWKVHFRAMFWQYPFTIMDYFEEWHRLTGQDTPNVDRELMSEIAESQGLSIRFEVECTEDSIESEVFKHEDRVRLLHEQIVASLTRASGKESILVFFDFPEEVEVVCEQYLLYFGQFLKDLGVNAETSLSHEAGRALFTVTPTDREDALDNIRVALEVYLKLPSSPIEDAANESVEVLTLRSELHQLHAKLNLAAARLELKNATIEAKEQTILGKQQIIELVERMKTGQVVEASTLGLDRSNAKEQKTESVIDGYVSLTTLEKHGVQVELGAIYKILKRLFIKARPSEEEPPPKGDWR